MKTKKIWMWSFIFGIIATLILYISLFTNLSTDVSADADIKTSEVKEVSEDIKPAKEELEKRAILNPMVEVSKGKRAISLYVALAEGLSGYIEPNSYVDIVAYESSIEMKSLEESEEQAEKKYKTASLVLQKVKVLATGNSSDSKEKALQYETVTVEVTPEEGVILSLAAKDKDGFYLLLRNSDDEEVKEKIKETREVIKEGSE